MACRHAREAHSVTLVSPRPTGLPNLEELITLASAKVLVPRRTSGVALIWFTTRSRRRVELLHVRAEYFAHALTQIVRDTFDLRKKKLAAKRAPASRLDVLPHQNDGELPQGVFRHPEPIHHAPMAGHLGRPALAIHEAAVDVRVWCRFDLVRNAAAKEIELFALVEAARQTSAGHAIVAQVAELELAVRLHRFASVENNLPPHLFADLP